MLLPSTASDLITQDGWMEERQILYIMLNNLPISQLAHSSLCFGPQDAFWLFWRNTRTMEAGICTCMRTLRARGFTSLK